MNSRRNEAALSSVRAILAPLKQDLANEIGKIQAEIRGGTEAIGAVARHQAEQHALLTNLLLVVQQLEARVTSLELKALGESVH